MDTGYAFVLLVQAYFDCRQHKRNSDSALRFEADLERNLSLLHEQVMDGTYRPGRSICFINMRPRPREIWAASFPDRVVHHLLYNHIKDRFLRSFIADSSACIPGRGTLYAAQRLESRVRSQTQNWTVPGYYLKMDLANFFVSIDKRIVWLRVGAKVPDPWWRNLAALILFHDPRENYEYHGPRHLLDLVPPHKRLLNAQAHCGLPIGNLSSQFFANVLLNGLDQHVKHLIKARHYVRYVDDFVILHESAQWLNDAHAQVNAYLPSLDLALNPKKTILQPIDRGIDFVGHVIKPWRREVRRRTVRTAIQRIETAPPGETYALANSYLGLLRQTSSYRDRALVANAARKRGHCIDGAITKTHPIATRS